MKGKKYFLSAGCLLLFALVASTSLAATPCEDAFANAQAQCTSAPAPVFNYLRNYVPELYTGPYVMWWVGRLLEPQQDWEVASNKFFDSLPGAALPDGTIFEQNVPVPMSDGLKLACNVFRPDKPGRFPVMMNFTPFSKDVYLQHDDFGVSSYTGFESINPGWWVQNDYVVILCDNRGAGRSPSGGTGGNYDYYDGIEWAGTQSWSNGKVGMFGHSALCSSTLAAAGMVDINGNPNAPPHLTAILPWGCTTDPRDQQYPGGIPETHFKSSRGVNKPLWQIGQIFPERPALPTRKLEAITIPALLACDWADKKQHLRGTLRSWRTISTPLEHRWLYMHSLRKWQGLYTPLEHRRIQLMFADHYLKGERTGIRDWPHVRLGVQVRTLDWLEHFADDWPLPWTAYTKLYLGDYGSLNERQPRRAGSVSYNSTDKINGNAIFDFTFEQDTEISGHIMAKLWVSAKSANDMDLFLTMRKLNAYGYEVNFDADILPGRLPVDYGWMRASKRALDPALSKPWLPEQLSVLPGPPEQKLTPGQIVPVEVQFVGSSTMFYAGETLRLEIAGYMPPDNLFAYDSTVNSGVNTIYFGSNYDSYLMVPEVPPVENANVARVK